MLGHTSPFQRAFGADLFGWDDLFQNFERAFRQSDGGAQGAWSTGRGPVGFVDKGDAYVLSADLPGLTEKEVKVELHDGVLTVGAERSTVTPEGYRAHRRERPTLKFSRSFRLGDAVDAARTTAEMNSGTLTIRVAKAAESKPRQIPVRAN